MNEQTNTETPVALVSRYNALVVQAVAAGIQGQREVMRFADRTVALARIARLESALAAHASGERAEEKREQPPGRARLLADPRAEQARQQTLADQEEALSVAKKTKKRVTKKATNGNGAVEHKWAAQHKIIAKLLSRQKGCTREEVLEATGWPTVSVTMQARIMGVEVRKEKTAEGLRYYIA
jgi:hypothetical protein